MRTSDGAVLISRQWIAFLAILLLGVLFRFHALERQSLWDDEMSTIHDLNLPLSAWPQRFQTYEMHPPLYFLQLKVWAKISGRSLASLRANSALWGSLTLLLIFLLARRYWGVDTGLVAMMLLAVSPYHLAYSQELRAYAFAGALTVLAFLLLEKCLEKDATFKTWALLAGVLTAELYAHYWGSFAVAALIVYGWRRSTGEQRLRLLAVGGVAVGLFALWLPMLRGQLRYIGDLSFWVPLASPANLARTFMAFTGLYFNHASLAFQAPGPDVWLELVGLMTLLIAGLGLWIRPRVAMYWLGLGLGLPYILSYWVHGIYLWYRYPSLMYPAFILALASGLRIIPERWLLRWIALSLMVFQALWSCGVYMTSWQKANPKDVMAYVHELKNPGAVVIRPTYFSPLFSYYDHPPTQVFDQDKLDEPKKRAKLKGKKIIFLAFDAPSDPVASALITEFSIVSARYFPGYAHLGITVYELK